MATTASSLPVTSAAVNIQIIEPKNYAGGEASSTQKTAPATQQSAPQAAPAPQQQDTFGSPSQGASLQNDANGTPQQQLQDAYHKAQQAKNDAEQSRNEYLELAGSLNSQAYDQEMASNQLAPSFVPPAITGGNGMMNQPINQPNMTVSAPGSTFAAPPQSQQSNPFALQPPMPPQLPQPPQAPPQALPPAPQQQQQMQLPPAPQQPQLSQAQQEDEMIKQLPLDQLNMLLAEAPSINLKLKAMGAIAAHQQGDANTFELLRREALTDTTQLDPMQKAAANQIRQVAIWTLGILNATQNAQAPSETLTGLNTFDAILSNPNEEPGVQVAVMQALQTMNRKDAMTLSLAEKALKNASPDVQAAARDFVTGTTFELPPASQQQQTPAMMPQPMGLPSAQPALPPGMMMPPDMSQGLPQGLPIGMPAGMPMPSAAEMAQMQQMLQMPGAKEQVAQMLSQAGMGPVSPEDIDQMMQLMSQGQG